MPKPSCDDANFLTITSRRDRHAAFAKRRRRVEPTAIGQINAKNGLKQKIHQKHINTTIIYPVENISMQWDNLVNQLNHKVNKFAENKA